MQSINLFPNLVSRRITPHNIRCISSSTVSNKKYSLPYKSIEQLLHPVGNAYRLHPAKALYKLLYRQKKENPFFVRPPVGRPSISIETATAAVHSSRICDSKRVRVLNKLFMRYIPEVLATSELGFPLIQYNVQFSGVRVGQHYDSVRVYWIPNGTAEDAIVQNLLNQVAYPLRSELINLRLMGLVPQIHFAKDKRHEYIREMERRFRIADYGKDYIPSFMNENSLKKDLTLQIQLPQELREQITSIDGAEELTEEEERSLPSRITNTFGLNHKKIMDSILQAKNKAHIHSQSTESLIGESVIKEVPFNYEAQPMENWNRKAFLEYMKNQRSKRKLVIRTRNRELSDEIREASRKQYVIEEEVDDTEYNEFVKNAFPDVVESFDDDRKLEFEQ